MITNLNKPSPNGVAVLIFLCVGLAFTNGAAMEQKDFPSNHVLVGTTAEGKMVSNNDVPETTTKDKLKRLLFEKDGLLRSSKMDKNLDQREVQACGTCRLVIKTNPYCSSGVVDRSKFDSYYTYWGGLGGCTYGCCAAFDRECCTSSEGAYPNPTPSNWDPTPTSWDYPSPSIYDPTPSYWDPTPSYWDPTPTGWGGDDDPTPSYYDDDWSLMSINGTNTTSGKKNTTRTKATNSTGGRSTNTTASSNATHTNSSGNNSTLPTTVQQSSASAYFVTNFWSYFCVSGIAIISFLFF
jgi:hypothetical protein